MTLIEALDTVSALPPAWTALILFASSLIEYVFPPFPGDTVTLAGAVLVARGASPVWLAFAALTAGGVLGSWLVYAAGGALARWQTRHAGPRGDALVDDIAARFRRHGAAYLVVNRFLPGVRAFFFVAAGLAGLSARAVLLWSSLSLLAWNALLLALGLSIGRHLGDLETAFAAYQAAAWGAVAVVVSLWAWRAWRRRAGRRP